MLKRIIPLAVAGYALWQWQQRRNDKRLRPQGKPEAVTTWEGEGGALHGTGAHLGPEPTHHGGNEDLRGERPGAAPSAPAAGAMH